MWKRPQLLSLFMHWNYFSVSAGLLRSFTSPKAIDPYLLYFAESKVTGLGEVSCLADMKKLLATQCEKIHCMQARWKSGSLHLETYHLLHLKKDGLPIPFTSFLSGPAAAYCSIWTLTSERVLWLAPFNCTTTFLLKIKQFSREQRWSHREDVLRCTVEYYYLDSNVYSKDLLFGNIIMAFFTLVIENQMQAVTFWVPPSVSCLQTTI